MLFWQVLNQSVNFGINHANGRQPSHISESSSISKVSDFESSPFPPSSESTDYHHRNLIKAYFGAVMVSCGVAYFFNRLGKTGSRFPFLKNVSRMAPFMAVACANLCNVAFTRSHELE